MAQLADIRTAQGNLEESFAKRMTELEAQLHNAGTAKDTVAKIAEEFRTFRELMFAMLGLLRKQIDECSQAVDVLETRHRRKALIFLGVPETEKDDCKATVLKTVQKMELTNISATDISSCHRIGASGGEHHRPILVWFSGVESRSTVWRAKTRLKGTSVSIKEFLTKSRQIVFGKARQHFGMRSCWTQDGVIHVKVVDGTRHKIATVDALNRLIQRYTKHGTESASGSGSGTGPGTSNPNFKPRK